MASAFGHKEIYCRIRRRGLISFTPIAVNKHNMNNQTIASDTTSGLSVATAVSAQSTKAYTAADQDASIAAYVEQFYLVEDGVGNFALENAERREPGTTSFWKMAEEFEMVEDVYDRTGDDRYKTMIGELYKGFIKIHGADWMWNEYNDDLMWITMGCLRAFRITGDSKYYQQGKSCFDATWARAYDPVNGGVWWKTDNLSKNACILGPTAIAAVLMYQCGAGDEYLDRARDVFEWERKILFHEDDENGLINDHVLASGEVKGGALSYNQGTFIGAAHLLNTAYGTTEYEPYAVSAARFMRDHCTGQNAPGVMLNDYRMGDGDNDGGGFKGIFARWCGKWVRETENTEILPWLQLNAQTVHDLRNTAGLSWGIWGKQTPDTPLASWECSSAVSMMQNVAAPGA